MITSTANAQVKNLAQLIKKSKVRTEQGVYVVEGVKMFQEAPKDEIVKACELCVEAGADFVKTSTGFSTGGATKEDIALMRKTVGPDVGVKASGGVRDSRAAIDMVEAGATRIGASATVAILSGAKSDSDY